MNQQHKSSEWVTYRPEIEVVDCTVRDGGLMNDHQFDDDFVKRVYDTGVAAGVDYMEFGYKADKKIFSPDQFGEWKFSDEDAIRRAIGEKSDAIKFCAMADAERTDYHNDILPADDSILDVIRVACYVHQIPTAIDMVKDAKDKGYMTSFNLMAVSTVPDYELDSALEAIAECEADVLYIVDSFGSLYSEQIEDLMTRYKETGKRIGIHAHNNQQMAFSNTICAITHGATMLDATLYGFGRGAGNCQMELLLGFLKNPKFNLRPVLKTVQEVMLPLSREIDWGYSIPYAITGQMNEHPRDAIKLRASDTPDDYVAFYDEMSE